MDDPEPLKRATELWQEAYRYQMEGELERAIECYQRSIEGIVIPRAWRRISSSSDIPVPKRSVREQSPPIERAATSMIHAPSPLTRSSAWTGPSLRPSA